MKPSSVQAVPKERLRGPAIGQCTKSAGVTIAGLTGQLGFTPQRFFNALAERVIPLFLTISESLFRLASRLRFAVAKSLV